MNDLFQPDSWLIRFLTRVCDLMILNVLTLVSCATIVCSGAAITALYSVTLRMMRKEDGPIVKGFFRSLRSNFIPSGPAAILLFADVLLFAVLHLALYADVLVFSPNIFILLSIIAVFLTVLLSYLFPLLARYDNTFLRQLGNAGRLALANLPVSCLLLAVNLLPLLAGMFLPALWAYVVGFMALVGIASGAYVNSFYLNRIFGQ